MELLFLGTGAGVPGKMRNVTSIALKMLNERGTVWLIDCGEATQHQILHTSLKPRRIEKIFITHLHGDHIFGLPGLLGSRSFQGGIEPLTVYGPAGIRAFIETALHVSNTHLQYPLYIEEIEEGTVFEDDGIIVTAGKLDHGIYSLGYRFAEKEKPGELLVDLLREDNIPPGPIYKQIKEGKQVTLTDGRKIDPDKYTSDPQPGKIVTVLGDTRPCDMAVQLSLGADLLVHEATFNAENKKMAHDYYHSTTSQAAGMAMRAGVKSLCLTHISSRYTREDERQLLNEAKELFQPVIIARDFLEVLIN
ncbi:ribonuclease Z [Domibacillus epiphyticus]|uniref:Ribonuclease Z n=1 Tax=Domibacillus epiphyticus TaxID=1714355 RepID=A0A1V2A4J3_9BACI|nr:ribonuclease Z [Domibacillus epiphyticus]OMP65918.1 ribonuclease Z [Domibacillus epiphyticus]